MHKKTLLHNLLCVLVIVIHTNCVLAHGDELLREVQALERAESPIGDTEPCENESSCICKGATLGDTWVPTMVPDGFAAWLLFVDEHPTSHLAPVLKRGFDTFPTPLPHPGGAAARALLQSFQF